ncbi:hypothetical protein AB0K60_07605 [Thermopolyspora sp. NPDC052614]|uniref:hypothetical protein n=1 Tax=Thermopolyspora sp. NPDC052614 TaxID=3155682 RepID=UPI00343381A8
MITRTSMASATLRPVEHAPTIAADAGFDGPASVRSMRVLRVLIAYALGTILRENGLGEMTTI